MGLQVFPSATQTRVLSLLPLLADHAQPSPTLDRQVSWAGCQAVCLEERLVAVWNLGCPEQSDFA